jgi:hypothetical protein
MYLGGFDMGMKGKSNERRKAWLVGFLERRLNDVSRIA